MRAQSSSHPRQRFSSLTTVLLPALGMLAVLLIGGQAAAAATPTAAPLPLLSVNPAPANGSQLITVDSAGAGSSFATLSAWQRGAGGGWVRVFGPVAARVGQSGIGAASEGSETTPQGDFPLTQAFGSLPDPGTRMPYFRSDALDWWDENPSSPTYNLHVRQAASPGGASENLLYSGTAYDYAVNIGYNLARVPGAGSAIFLHVGTGDATAGCVSIDLPTLQSILRWLDPAQHPAIDIRVGAPVVPTPQLGWIQARRATDALYQGVLGRAADPAGEAFYSAGLMAGGSLPAAATRMAASAESYRRVVTAAYATCLGRAPDPGGLAAYQVRLQTWSLAAVVTRMCGSPEAWDRSLHSAARWVSQVFPAVLGRPAAPQDLLSWGAVVVRSGLAAAAAGIVGSRESQVHQLDLVYLAMLGRHVDAGGAAAYAPSMTGRGVFTVPVAISGSAEFWTRSQTI